MIPSRPLLAGALFLLLATAALAQGSQTVAPGHLAAAREVALVAGVERTVDGLIPEFVNGLRAMSTTRPEIAKDLTDIIDKTLQPELQARKQEIIDGVARLFASRMSEAELKEVMGFYRSPTGQKYLSVEPIVTEIAFLDLQTWAQKTSEFAAERVRTELGKRGHQM